MSRKQERDGRKFGDAGRAVVEVLQAHGITGYVFTKRKHALVQFAAGGRPLTFRFACTPKDGTTEAKRVRRRLEALILEAGG